MTTVDLYPEWGVSENVCPKCGNGLTNRQGMEIHHLTEHGTKLSFAIVSCDECGKHHRKKRSVAKKSNNHFCSKECSKIFKRGKEAPPDHNFRKNGKVEYSCDNCGEINMEYPSVFDQSEHNFCDRACSAEWKRGREVDESHNFYQGGPEIVLCSNCGVELERKPAIAEDYDNFFCSIDCESEWKSENKSGENHPNWKGGHDYNYGENWNQQRDKRLEKDNHQCVVCGMSNGEHKQNWGCSLHVHHIERKESFRDENGELDYERANRLENLITLCYKCHSRWEGIPLRPQQ